MKSPLQFDDKVYHFLTQFKIQPHRTLRNYIFVYLQPFKKIEFFSQGGVRVEQEMLWVDLSKGEVHSRPGPSEWVRDFTRGEGAAMRLLWALIVPEADGTDPRQPLIFATEPSSG